MAKAIEPVNNVNFHASWIYHETLTLWARWNFSLSFSFRNVCNANILWSYWIKQKIVYFHSIIFSHLDNVCFSPAHTKKKRVENWKCDAKNEMQRKIAELVAQFKWVHWLSGGQLYFLSYTRLLMRLARRTKRTFISRNKKSTDEWMCRRIATKVCGVT